MTATYDPSAMADGGLNQMRFELGDTDASGAVLSDEEISAAICAYADWNRAMEVLAEGVCRRFAYEVDISGDGMRMELSQRADRWAAMLKAIRTEKRKMMPRAGAAADTAGCPDHGGYFYAGMLRNPRAAGCGGENG